MALYLTTLLNVISNERLAADTISNNIYIKHGS